MDLKNTGFHMDESEILPKGAPSASTAWSAMLQLLDEELPTRTKRRKYLPILLTLFPLFSVWPLINRESRTQVLSLPAGSKISINAASGFQSKSPAVFGEAIVISYPKREKLVSAGEGIKELKTLTFSAASLSQIPVEQMENNTRNGDRLFKSPEQKSHNDKIETTAEEATSLEFQLGLSWSLPLPLGGAQNYFAGPGGDLQPYRYALPGAWMSLRADNYLFALSVDPFTSSMVKPAVVDSTVSVPDSLTRIVRSIAMTKLFGLSAALHIARGIGGHWWAGGNLQGYWWREAVGTIHEEIERTGPTTGQGPLTSQTDSGPVPDSVWTNLTRFQIFLNGELIYRSNGWQAGIQAGFTVTPLANYGNPKNMFNAAFFFRLPLFTKQLKVKESQ